MIPGPVEGSDALVVPETRDSDRGKIVTPGRPSEIPQSALQLLGAVAVNTMRAADVEDGLARVLEAVCRWTGWPIGHACLVHGDSRPRHVWYVEDVGRLAPLRDELEGISLEHGIVGRVLAGGVPVAVDIPGEWPGGELERTAAAGLRHALAVPVVVGSDIAAVLAFYSQDPPPADALELLRAVATQLAALVARRRMLAARHREEERLWFVLERCSDGAVVVDEGGAIVAANPGAARLFGLEIAELLASRPGVLAAPEWSDYVERSLAAQLAGRPPTSRYDLVVLDRSGERVPVELTVVAVASADERPRVHCVFRDLRALRRADRAFKESDERFRAVFDGSPVGMALASLGGRWLRVNDALCRLVGYSAAELLTMGWLELTHPDDRSVSAALGRRLLAGEASAQEAEKRYVRKDGTIVEVRLSVALVHDDAGAPAYVVAQVLEVPGIEQLARSKSPSAARDTGPLSAREQEVLELLASGLTSADVGTALGIAEETVQTHVRRSMAKLDARSRTQAVASAIRRGWLGDGSIVATT